MYRGEHLKNHVEEIFRKHGIKYLFIDKPLELREIEGIDLLTVIGTDRLLLEALQHMGNNIVPVFHINPPGYSGFFAAVDWNDLDKALSRIVRDKYSVEKYMRLAIEIDGSNKYYGLNELALFSSRSAVLVNYVLSIDNETIWRDTSDGVIVATPTGSTAYAYSAGGPIVMKNAEVFIVVPVNTLNPMHKPLVVPAGSEILLHDISSSVKCEAVIDGVTRTRVREKIKITRADKPALFIKLYGRLSEPIEKKTRLALETMDMPPSAKFVYKMIELLGETTMKDLVKITGLPERTVRYALSLLIRRGLVERIVNLRDTRQRIYRLAKRTV